MREAKDFEASALQIEKELGEYVAERVLIEADASAPRPFDLYDRETSARERAKAARDSSKSSRERAKEPPWPYDETWIVLLVCGAVGGFALSSIPGVVAGWFLFLLLIAKLMRAAQG